MEYCMIGKQNRIFQWTITCVLCAIAFAAAVGMLIYGLSFYTALDGALYIFIAAALFVAGAGILAGAFYHIAWVGARKYALDEAGITVCYLNKFTAFYPWSVFQDICVCDINHAPKNPKHFDLVIRLVAGKEPVGPKSDKKDLTFWGKEQWRDEGYNTSRYKSILTLTYTPERLAKISALSSQEIAYSLTKEGKALFDVLSKAEAEN